MVELGVFGGVQGGLGGARIGWDGRHGRRDSWCRDGRGSREREIQGWICRVRQNRDAGRDGAGRSRRGFEERRQGSRFQYLMPRRQSSRPSAPISPIPRSGPPPLVTAPDGTAQVDFPLPDSLTTWKVKAWTLGPGRKSARPSRRSSRPRTCSSGFRLRGSLSKRTKSFSRPTSTTSSRTQNPCRSFSSWKAASCSRWPKAHEPCKSPPGRNSGSTGG